MRTVPAPSPVSQLALPEAEGFPVPTPADDDGGVIRQRDPGLDAWLDDCARNDAAAEGRVSYRDSLADFVTTYRRYYGLPDDDDTDPTPPGAPARRVAA